MVQLQQQLDKLHAAGVGVVGISPDKVDVLKQFAEAESIEFPLLSDSDSEVIKSFDIHFQRGLPHPGTFVIDQQGVVRAKLFREGYRERHPASELLEAAKGLSAQ